MRNSAKMRYQGAIFSHSVHKDTPIAYQAWLSVDISVLPVLDKAPQTIKLNV
jgi:hypothetical protein